MKNNAVAAGLAVSALFACASAHATTQGNHNGDCWATSFHTATNGNTYVNYDWKIHDGPCRGDEAKAGGAAGEGSAVVAGPLGGSKGGAKPAAGAKTGAGGVNASKGAAADAKKKAAK